MTSVIKIIKEPDGLLHQKCESVNDFKTAKKIVRELLITVRSVATFWNRWLGFAANQIGYPQRIIVLRDGNDRYTVLINPVLIEKRLPFPYLERCHSIQGVYLVKRYLWAKVKFQDVTGISHEKILRGPSALYQEMDHIDGIMISEIGRRVL